MNCEEAVTKIEVVQKESIKFFKSIQSDKKDFLKIFVQQPKFVATIRRNYFERGVTIDNKFVFS